jgi:hypothetical protein
VQIEMPQRDLTRIITTNSTLRVHIHAKTTHIEND